MSARIIDGKEFAATVRAKVADHVARLLAILRIPSRPRVLNQRVFFGAPTEGIVVQVLFLVEQQLFKIEGYRASEENIQA